MDMDMDTHGMDTTARDLLMLSQRLRLMLMPTTDMDMVLDTEDTDTEDTDTEDTDTPTPMLVVATTTARGLLMLSPRSLPATLVWSEVSTVPTLASPLPLLLSLLRPLPPLSPSPTPPLSMLLLSTLLPPSTPLSTPPLLSSTSATRSTTRSSTSPRSPSRST